MEDQAIRADERVAACKIQGRQSGGNIMTKKADKTGHTTVRAARSRSSYSSIKTGPAAAAPASGALPAITPFDSNTATLCGQFVQAAYTMYSADPHNTAPAPSSDFPAGFELVGWIQMQDFLIESTDPVFYGFVVQNTADRNRFVVVIRGTSDLLEWWDDVFAQLETPFNTHGYGEVGEGFLRIYNTLKIVERPIAAGTLPEHSLAQAGFSRQVALLTSRHASKAVGTADFTPSAVVEITGHSLGGALATLYALENALSDKIANPLLCTFASPAVGNSAFATAFNKLGLTSWRIANVHDVVPMLPLGFSHVDTLEPIDSTGKAKASLTCWHSLSTYLSVIDTALLPDPDCRLTAVVPQSTGQSLHTMTSSAPARPAASGDYPGSRPFVIDLYHGDDVPLGGFAQAKDSGIAFLIHKATEGPDVIDARYAERRDTWMSGGAIPVTDVDGTSLKLMPRFAAYHFFHGQDPEKEAAHFLAVADLRPGDDAVVDWEQVGGSGGYEPSADAVDAFCSAVEQKLGFPMIVYSGNVAKQQLVGKDPRFAKRRLWLASYGPTYTVQETWDFPWLWQNNGDQFGPGPHSIPGINGYCDNSTVVPPMVVSKLYEQWGGAKLQVPAVTAAGMRQRPTAAAGGAVTMPTPTLQIAILNESSAIADAAIQRMISAFETQWNRDLIPVWGVHPAMFTFIPKGQAPAAGTWWVVFLDDSDQADALAYHDLTNEGLPISKVFVRTILADNADVGVGATHEICEMAVDPWLNSAYQDPQGVFWAGEICDPVEDDRYGYKIGDILVTDFVTPSWFGYKYSRGPFDLGGNSRAAFEVLTGGYAQKFDQQGGWVQVTGSQAMKSARAQPARGSRRNRRCRQWQNWERSNPIWNRRGR